MDQEKPPSILALIFFISTGSVGAVLYSSGIPILAEDFGISDLFIQTSMTVYLLAYASSQLIYGPLAKGLGRKRSILAGIALSAFGCLLCVLSSFSKNYLLFLFGRLLQGTGAGAGLALTFTLIADFFPKNQVRRVTAYASTGFSLLPGFAVAVGGFLVTGFDWPSCFVFLFFYNVAIYFLALRLPVKGTPLDFTAIRWGKIRQAYEEAAKNRDLVLFGCLAGLNTLMVYMFNTIGPFIGADYFDLRPDQYGTYNLIIPPLNLVGYLVSAGLSHRMKSKKVMLIGIAGMLLGAFLMIAFLAFGSSNPWVFFGPAGLMMLAMPLTYSTVSSLAVQSHDDKPTAAASLSFLNMGVATMGLMTIGKVQFGGDLFLPLFLFGGAFLLLLLTARKVSRDLD